MKASGAKEASVACLAGAAGESRTNDTCTERGRGFEPFVDEEDDCVAILESSRPLLRERSPSQLMFLSTSKGQRSCDGASSSGCERDPWTGASAPAPPWTGATESDLGVGEQLILGSSRAEETSALADIMLDDRHLAVDCDAQRHYSRVADGHGDPPHPEDTGAHQMERMGKGFDVCVGSREKEFEGGRFGQSKEKKKKVGSAAQVDAAKDCLAISEEIEVCQQGVKNLTCDSLPNCKVNSLSNRTVTTSTTVKMVGTNDTEAQADVNACRQLLEFRRLLTEVTREVPITGTTVIGDGTAVQGDAEGVAKPCCEGRELKQCVSVASLAEEGEHKARSRCEELEAELQRHRARKLFDEEDGRFNETSLTSASKLKLMEDLVARADEVIDSPAVPTLTELKYCNSWFAVSHVDWFVSQLGEMDLMPGQASFSGHLLHAFDPETRVRTLFRRWRRNSQGQPTAGETCYSH